ncbi:MAG: acetyl-CoA carboxylase biotin carboxylase subunit [Clostridiales bacterium]|jgi:acetyl-CoA carboxylase biotin carboxylase subunit|nr:acetyl-CoA carboxylase biotin carboxylase subunit [Clostridiales bacterium]
MFSKILIANRGEVAMRVIRACKEMGVSAVAVFSEADRDALHVSLADEAYCIGKARTQDSYLNINAILSAAMASKAEAIHPGYGFLSENPEFARLCEENCVAFIGPGADIIAKMGDKDEARRTMAQAGLPVIPGSDLLSHIDEARRESRRIGFPLLIKARSGGGGKGIRLVNDESELERAYNSATAEAQAAFGDGAVYMEKYLTRVKHIEAQVIADNFGNILCLGERDCSMQRGKQKLIEESPSSLDGDARGKMFDYAVLACRASNYRGVGTLEFLYDGASLYFMEMNTRLQVEHPVTEMRTQVDLVKWQIRVASGAKLSLAQKDISFGGHAIECRINAEDRDFRPSPGTIKMLHVPGGPWVRFDTAIYQGYTIPPFYDSMIGKLIVHAHTRDEAIRKMKAALCELIIEGIDYNAQLQMELLSMPEFENSTYTTEAIDNLRRQV